MHKAIFGCGLIFSILAFNNLIAKFSESKSYIPDVCNTENNAFQAGESITYKLYYNLGYLWVSAGS